MTLKTMMERKINQSGNNIGGLIVRKKDQILYEEYYNGCTAKNHLNVFSVTKSIISCLIGIALQQGKLDHVDHLILDFFPDYEVKRGETTLQKITMKDMMSMTAPYKYKTEPYLEYFSSPNAVQLILDYLGGKGKIGDFRYTPFIGPDLFSAILMKVTGQSVIDYANENLFGALGLMPHVNVPLMDRQAHVDYMEQRKVAGWSVDDLGINNAGWGLTLSTREMSTIGQLYLNDGMWQGKQLVSKEWIKDSTREHSICKEFKMSYGYLWWVINGKEHAYAAMGDGGNVIYINEKKQIVVAINSLYKPNITDRIELIREYIEPVFED